MPHDYAPHACRRESERAGALRVFFAFLVAAAAAFAAYAAVAAFFLEPYIYSQHGRIMDIFSFYDMPHGNDTVLFLGSSQIREDIDANIIDGMTSRRLEAFNLGFTSDTPLRRLTELDQIKRYGPRAVFIGLTLFGINNESVIPEDHLSLVSGSIRLDDYSRSLFSRQNLDSANLDSFGRLVYKRKFFLPMVLEGLKSLKELVTAGLFNQSAVKMDYAHMLSNFKNPSIYTESQSLDSLREKLEKNRDVLDTYIISNETNSNRKALVYFIEELRKSGIKVFLIDMPVHPLLYQNIPAASKSYYDSFLERSVVPLVDGYHSYRAAYNESMFIDLSHLNADGRARLSAAMAGIINGVF